MTDLLPDIGVISYATGAVVFLILALVLMTGQRGRPHKVALMWASLISAIWMGIAAWTAASQNSVYLASVLEPLRDLALLAFLVRVLSAAYASPVQAARYVKRMLSVFSLYTVVLILMVLYRFEAGKPALYAGGMDLLMAGFLFMAVAGLVLVEQLMRNARPESRRAVKYLGIGLGALFAYDFYLYSHALLLGGIDPEIWDARGFINAIVVPVIGIAAVRDPQWSLDIFVSRRVVFHTAALMGAALYLFAIGTGGYLIEQYGGTWGTIAEVAFLFGAMLVLAILSYSSQLRASLRVVINKHFFHYKFEYREEWLRFIKTLTLEEPDQRLRERTIKAVAEIQGCTGGLLWMYGDSHRYDLVASWQMPAPVGEPALDANDSLIRFLREQQWVINLDEYARVPALYHDLQLPGWLSQFNNAWLVTPLVFHERLLGLVVLARPPVTHALNWEDYDLMRIIGRQSAVHLAQLDAVQALAQAKQFEACNRLSAYVMHDLKNLIAQLSLVVSNAARHKHNPQFMEDAIQTVDNAVNKMNRLLTDLRSGMSPEENVQEIELCDVLDEAMVLMAAGTPAPSLDCQVRGMYAKADHDRLVAVVGHMVRNAQDATPDTGMVIIRLFKKSACAVIEVQDNGEGMDEAFIRDRLFKPFDSTKGKSGMGIGVYETREFLRSFGGEVEVISRPGEGSTFRLQIPISRETENSVKSSDKSIIGTVDGNRLKEITGR